MKFGDILSFRKDLFFEGAVQADWFYQPEKASIVAENFVFHGSEYYGVSETAGNKKFTDTVRFVNDISQRVYDDQTVNSLTLAIAGYGTGKSHLAVTLATLLSGSQYQPATYLRILNNIRDIDSIAADSIGSYTQKQNLVLVLNGMRDFNLHYELLKSAQKSLKLYGCDDTNLKKLNRALETAFRFFERNADNMLPAFESFAPNFGYLEKGAVLAEKLRNNLGEDEAAFNIINAVYEDVNGHAIRWDEGISASAVLETLMSEYCGISGPFSKIVIIFDEFGRYLEYASSTTTAHSGDSALQQIFECSQNFGGNLQVINFIQTDIKAYLQRVDQSTNISRYIGRYDASEKYRLSSNLETIFANLIQRKDKDIFESTVVSWQNSKESLWKEVFDSINNWLPTSGLWRDYTLFRKIAVEGIYPLHPLSTYMLTKLSDYLQNRSSLMLLSRYIDDLADVEIVSGGSIPLVLPENLLKGDLFTEMLAAEEEGRQVSQHCIRYNNALGKHGDKLSENSQKVLRANLALRILRCRTTSYDDAIKGLALFSGLSVDSVKEELIWLENEYAIIGFDDHAACFDFLEDSSGAHDFKTYFRRLRASVVFNNSVLDESPIRELAGVIQPQNTNFDVNHKISTSEWQFSQELIPIEDLSEGYVQQRYTQWKKNTSIDKPKGILIWLYSDSETTEEEIERAQAYARIVSGAPILLMQLKDTEGLLKGALCDYLTLQSMSDKDQQKYGRHYLDKIQQTEDNIQQSFEQLKKARLQITENGVVSLPSRITPALTEIFENIYPKAVPFDFDGFASKQPGKARKAFCSIVRLILSDQISENTIHSFPADVRNRFDATLFINNSASWKVVNSDYQVIPPMNKIALSAYNEVVNLIPEGESVLLGEVIDVLSAPPYGMNDYVAVYMLATVFSNLNYCLRIEYNNLNYTINKWKDVVIGDSKIELASIRQSVLRRINAGAVADQFLALFSRINANTDTAMVEPLNKELETMLRGEDIPAALTAQLQLAKNKLQEGNRILRDWNKTYENAMDYYDKLLAKQDFNSGLQCLKELKSYAFFRVFVDTNYVMSEEQMSQLKNASEQVKSKIEPYLRGWISQQRCRNVENMGGFRSFMKKLHDLLEELGYTREAQLAQSVSEKELSDINAIRERQELQRSYKTFISDMVPIDTTPYVRLQEWKKDGEKIVKGIEKNSDFLGSEAEGMKTAITKRMDEIDNRIHSIDDRMNSIYDRLYAISTIDDIEWISSEIKSLSLCGISDTDMDDFREIDSHLNQVLADVETMMEEQNNRTRFKENYTDLHNKYELEDMDFDVLSVLEGIAESVERDLDKKDEIWAEKHLSKIPDGLPSIHSWIQDTEILPNYLSDHTKNAYNEMKKTVEEKMSKARIDDVVLRFDSLSLTEKQSCLNILSDMIQ